MMRQSAGELQREGSVRTERPEDKGGDKEGTVSAKAPRASTTLSRTRTTIANKGKGSKKRVQGGGWGQATQGLGSCGEGAGIDFTLNGTGWEIIRGL